MTPLFARTAAIAIAMASPLAAQAQLRTQDKVDLIHSLTSPLLQNLYLSADAPVSPALGRFLQVDDLGSTYSKPARFTLGLRLSSPPSESGASSTFLFAATMGRPASTDCQMYSLTPCQHGLPSTLSELARIRSISLSYRLKY